MILGDIGLNLINSYYIFFSSFLFFCSFSLILTFKRVDKAALKL